MKHEPLRTRPVEARLERALVTAAARASYDLAIVAHQARRWASATFTGVQHEIVVTAPRGIGFGDWVAALPEAELPIPGHLVASLAVDRIEDDGTHIALTLTVLIIEH